MLYCNFIGNIYFYVKVVHIFKNENIRNMENERTQEHERMRKHRKEITPKT